MVLMKNKLRQFIRQGERSFYVELPPLGGI